MPGQRGLDSHLCGFLVADFADHDDVRVLAQQGADAAGEREVDVVLDLHLVEGRLDHFNRVFHRAQVDLAGRQLPEGGVEGAGLA